MSWVINDSEEEEELDTYLKPPEPQVQTHSSISDFSSHEILLPTADKPSSISNFTTDNAFNNTNAVADSILIASVPAPVPVKPKRPKPRPAYKGPAKETDSIYQSTSAASVTASAINQISPRSSHQPLLGPSFSLDIAERTKTRKRNTTGSSTGGREPARSSSSFRGPGSAAQGSSKDVIITISSDGEQERTSPTLSERPVEPPWPRQSRRSPTSRAPAILHRGDTSTLPPSDPPSSVIITTRAPSPLFDHQRMDHESTPPSSPFQHRRAKRRVIDDDDDFLDDNMDVENDKACSSTSTRKDRESRVKKQKKDTEKKPRERKTKAAVEGDTASLAKASANFKKRLSKVKEKAPVQEFKSKEFVEDSEDDDLLLVPKSSKSAPHASCSDPASAEISVQASISASVQPSMLAPTETMQASDSILPSLSTSMRPSADVSAPPPSPSIQLVSKSDKSKPDKGKKKRAAPGDSSSGAAIKGDALSGETDIADLNGTGKSDVATIEPPKKVRKEKKDKKGKKKAEVFVLIGDAGKQDASPTRGDLGSTEQDISVAGKTRPKAKKSRKQGTIISSDEDEPEFASSKDNPVEMEVDRTKTSRGEDKENEALSYPKAQSQKTPAPSSSTSASVAQVRPSNPKSRPSTPHMPPRRDSMSALIRRVSSKVQSPLSTPSPAYAHSPLVKASRMTISRIAPLHPNRRTPPPAPPRPPAPKKSKKMLELEEKWEMELAETVEGWSCMADDERAALRRAKRDVELGYDD